MNTLKQLFFFIKSNISIFLLLICLTTTSFLQAQVNKSASSNLSVPTNKTVNCTAGGLSALLNATEKTYVEDLTITGIIDASDFVTMRDVMPALKNLNLTGITAIAAYNSDLGPLLVLGGYNPAIRSMAIFLSFFNLLKLSN